MNASHSEKIAHYDPKTKKNSTVLQMININIPLLFISPTSHLGSGGLEWHFCVQPLFFSTLWVSTLWGGVYPSPYPCFESPPCSLKISLLGAF